MPIPHRGPFLLAPKKPTKAALLRPASKITLTGTFATPCGGLLGLLSEAKVNDEHLETVGSLEGATMPDGSTYD